MKGLESRGGSATREGDAAASAATERRARVLRLCRESVARGDDAHGLHELLGRFADEVSLREQLLPMFEALIATASDESIELLDAATADMFVRIWAEIDAEEARAEPPPVRAEVGDRVKARARRALDRGDDNGLYHVLDDAMNGASETDLLSVLDLLVDQAPPAVLYALDQQSKSLLEDVYAEVDAPTSP